MNKRLSMTFVLLLMYDADVSRTQDHTVDEGADGVSGLLGDYVDSYVYYWCGALHSTAWFALVTFVPALTLYCLRVSFATHADSAPCAKTALSFTTRGLQ
ncbi:hypothetical protein V1527DRAFT_476743 [Lipomyces starkeyi]